MGTFADGQGWPATASPMPDATMGPQACALPVWGPSPLPLRIHTVRLVYVTETYPPEVNGVSLTVQRAVSHLRRQGHDVSLVRPRQRGEAPLDARHEWRTAGLPLPMYPDLRFGLAWPGQVRERLLQWRPALVHLATPGPLAWAALQAARALHIPVTAEFRTNFHLYSAHYGLSWLSPLVLRGLRAFHDRAQRNYVPTHLARRELARAGFSQMEVIGRGVDTERFHPRHRCDWLREQLAPPDAPLLLYVGRLAAEKNVELALQAYDVVRAGMPRAGMVVVGDGPMRRNLQTRYPQVRFVGMQTGEALSRYYAAADLFLFPSLSDTFGNVVLEALASGVPVVAFDLGAAAELVQGSGAGRVIPNGQPEQFITAACALAWQHRHAGMQRERARALALNARWDHVLNRFEQSLLEVAHGHDAPKARQARAA